MQPVPVEPGPLRRSRAGRRRGASTAFGFEGTLALLRDLGCQWNEQVALYAADSGHWALVQWLHAQGCPLSRDVAHRLYLETEELAFLANVA